MPTDFSYASKYNKEANFSRVKFGADAPLLETELNEMQEIQGGKLRELVKTILPDSLTAGSFSYSGGTLTFNGVVALVAGNVINIPSATFAVAEGQSVYIRVFEKEATYETPLKKNGYESGEAIANQMLDSRIGYETSRRIVTAYSLTKDKTLAGDYLKLGTITGGQFKQEAQITPLVSNTDKEFWNNKAQYEDVDAQTGTFISTTKSRDALIELMKVEGASYQKVTTQGKNLFNGKLEVGTIDATTGLNLTLSTRARNIGYIPVSSNSNYSIKVGTGYSINRVFYYDSNTAYISNIQVDVNQKTFTTPSNALYVKFALRKSVEADILQSDLDALVASTQLELGSSSTAYEAFVPNSPSPDYPAPITNAKNFEVVACGKNLFDGIIEYGSFYTSGAPYNEPNGLRTKNFIPVVPGKTYTISNDKGYVNTLVYEYDANYVFVKANNISPLVVGSTTRYIKFRTDYTKTQNDLTVKYLVELGSIATAYEPYKSNKITITRELASLPNGVKDTLEYIGDGKAKFIKRVGSVVLDGSIDESWVLSETLDKTLRFGCQGVLKGEKDTDTLRLRCDKFKTTLYADVSDYEHMRNASQGYPETAMVYMNKTRLASHDANGFKAWLQSNPITVSYELATPVETIIDLPPLTSYLGLTNLFSTANPLVNLTANFKSKLWADYYEIDKKIGTGGKFIQAQGTASAISLSNIGTEDGASATFIVIGTNYSGESVTPTTVNGKPLYKPNTTSSPKLTLGKAETIWYNKANDCFYIQASAEESPKASGTVDGLMSKEDYTRLKDVEAGANKYTHPNDANTRHVSDAQITSWTGKAEKTVATPTADGLLSKADKDKLDKIAPNANNYTHPTSGVGAGTYKKVTVDANGHVTGGSNPATVSEFGITDAYTKSEVDNLISGLINQIDWKESVATFADIAKTYPTPEDGWTVNVKDTDYTYRYNGSSWIVISTNAIPKATTSVDGLMSKEDKTKLDGIATNANNYSHPNHTGDVTSTGDGATLIGDNKVTNAKLADMGANTIKGAINAGDPADLTPAQVRAMLNVADGAKANVQPDWNVSDTGSDAFIKNKPSVFPANNLIVQSDNYKIASDLPSTYPRGITIFFSNNPTSKFNGIMHCTVQTIKGYNMSCTQFIFPYDVDAPVYYRHSLNSDSWGAWRKQFGSGESNPIIKSATAPADTTAIWIDTSTGLTKYHNGTSWVGTSAVWG